MYLLNNNHQWTGDAKGLEKRAFWPVFVRKISNLCGMSNVMPKLWVDLLKKPSINDFCRVCVLKKLLFPPHYTSGLTCASRFNAAADCRTRWDACLCPSTRLSLSGKRDCS